MVAVKYCKRVEHSLLYDETYLSVEYYAVEVETQQYVSMYVSLYKIAKKLVRSLVMLAASVFEISCEKNEHKDKRRECQRLR